MIYAHVVGWYILNGCVCINTSLPFEAIFSCWLQSSWYFYGMKYWLLGCLVLTMMPLGACRGSSKETQELFVMTVQITDGDTFIGRGQGVNWKVRLRGIDAPERGQDFSKKSHEKLGELCRAAPLRLQLVNKDGFGRWVADVYDRTGRHINAEMVATGMAWHFRKYSQDPLLERLEQAARKTRRGLWSMPQPMPPWEYRAQRRATRKRS